MASAGRAPAMSGQEWDGEEKLLLDRIRRLEANRTSLFAIHVHLSALKSAHRQPTFLRIAGRSFEALAGNFDVTFYRLGNGDFILLCRDTPIEEVDDAIEKVRALFADAADVFGEAGSLNDRFTTWYDMAAPGDYDALLAEAEHLHAESEERERKNAEKAKRNRAKEGAPLDPRNLAAINQLLLDTKITDLVRQQPAVVIHPGGQGEILFIENFISMGELQKRVAPAVNMFSSPWLFQYLTQTLDKRMLILTAKRDFSTMRHPVSLNLNIATVLGPDFQRFHQAIGPNGANMAVEFQLIDVFADLDAYGTARDLLQENGYKVVLDGLNPGALDFFDPEPLGADYIKIAWEAELLETQNAEKIKMLRDSIARYGADKVILCRVDSDEGVKWGFSIGALRIQGRYADKVAQALAAKGKL